MSAIRITTLIVGVTLLMNTFTFGQGKQQALPTITNPFKQKTQLPSSSYSQPATANGRAVQPQERPALERVNESVYASFKNKKVGIEDMVKDLNSFLGLSEQYTFKKNSVKTDEQGVVHATYQQVYKGYVVEGNVLMLHSKNGVLKSLNGKLADLETVETRNVLTTESAMAAAKEYLNVTKTIQDYPVETVLTRIPSPSGAQTRLAHKVRIDSQSPFEMCYVYVDTQTGDILHKINLLAHADVAGTGQTLYSGNQALTVDSQTGSFRLRDNGRKIQTFNGTFATDLNETGFVGATDFTSPTSSFAAVPQLSSFTITAVAQAWWFNSFSDELPDLYIRIKDGANQTVYTSGFLNNTNPPLTFSNLSVYLTNPPYTVEVLDADEVGNDDLGGSYTLSTTTGNQSWSGNGNSGSYSITSSGNPAIDVHWGMQKSYDFYLSVFNRNSYDGAGSVIKQYINPPTLQSQYGYSPNNASAFPAPYNIMQYGLGDGISFKPLVGLDVEGHEYTHMVVEKNGNGGLVYEGESGALNESFADIFGVCIEFFSGVNPDWFIGEDVMVGKPYLRSMADPNGGQQPDTYGGQFWANPANLENDYGGVHINSGVQNFWFYLLSQGGTGTNDLGKAYAVTGIGITQARQIAYRNLVTYLGPNATFADAYAGSLQAAEDIFGNPSTQYTAVRQAWYAVGLGNDPSSYCSGVTQLTAGTGTISDGSGGANYANNANCKWVIAPSGATQLSLSFTEFETEADFDIVYIYDGPDDTFPLLATWWGNTLPPVITTSPGVGAMCIKFISDIDLALGGWSANYTTTIAPTTCSGATILGGATGTFTDGSSSNVYGNNQTCYWFIAPPCATSVTLSFSQFNTELDYDGVIIYDDFSGTNRLAVLTGTSTPNPITSTTGKMLVVFVSDYSFTLQGFSASYTSVGSATCSGITSLTTADSGVLADGSNTNAYCNNVDCQWLIQPPQATTVTLTFTQFDVEPTSPDGLTVYDAVEIYDGSTTSAPLLGRFSGNSIPPAVTSTGGSLLVRFFSDLEVSRPGWSAVYTSTQTSYCAPATTLTQESGTLTDGSANNQYANNTNCAWLIQPPDANSITLSFSAFQTELNFDGIIVYDGDDTTAPVLRRLSGATIPPSISSTGGSMYVEFLSDPAIRGNGWAATYTSTLVTGITETTFGTRLKLFPNPSNGTFTIQSNFDESLFLHILDVRGQEVVKTYTVHKGENKVDASDLAKGIYLVRVKVEDVYHTKRFIIY